jgi:hypothetical protein
MGPGRGPGRLGIGWTLSAAVALMLCAGRNLDRHISIINNTSENIIEIHIATARASSLEFDQLGDDILTTGEAKLWDMGDTKGYCRFDFAFMLEDRSIIRRRAVDVCKHSAIYVAEGASGRR